MFAARQYRDKKVLTVSGCPDLNSKQLVVFNCGELFLICPEQLARSAKLIWGSSNTGFVPDDEEGQFLEPTVR